MRMVLEPSLYEGLGIFSAAAAGWEVLVVWDCETQSGDLAFPLVSFVATPGAGA
jgi:hypothetical protein